MAFISLKDQLKIIPKYVSKRNQKTFWISIDTSRLKIIHINPIQSYLIQINPNQVFNPNHSDLKCIGIENLVLTNQKSD